MDDSTAMNVSKPAKFATHLHDRVSAADAEQLEKIFQRVLKLSRIERSSADAEELSRFVCQILQMRVIDRLPPTPSARLVEVVVPLQDAYPLGTQSRLASVSMALTGARELANDIAVDDKGAAVLGILDLALRELSELDAARDALKQEVAHV